MSDGAKGPLTHSFRPVTSQKQQSSMRVVTSGGLWCKASGLLPQQ
jgi:hypothetical protein